MVSNGYVRRNCHDCIFYEHFNDMGCSLNFCTFNNNWEERMYSITAYEYERSTKLKQKYDEPCKYYANIQEIKEKTRLYKRGINYDTDNV